MGLRKKSRAVRRQEKPALDPKAVEVGRRIRTARKKKGINQVALAKLAGVSQITVFRNEKGEVHPELLTLRGYAGVLGVTVESLLGSEAMQATGASGRETHKELVKTDSQEVPRNVARLLAKIPDLSEEELTFLSRFSRLEEGRTTEELETILLAMRLAKNPDDETSRAAFNEHLERRATQDGMRTVDIAPKPEPRKAKKR